MSLSLGLSDVFLKIKLWLWERIPETWSALLSPSVRRCVLHPWRHGWCHLHWLHMRLIVFSFPSRFFGSKSLSLAHPQVRGWFQLSFLKGMGSPSKTTPQVHDSLTGLSRWSSWWWGFILGKGRGAKSAKGTGAWGEGCRKPSGNFQGSSSPCEVSQDSLRSPGTSRDLWAVSQASSSEPGSRGCSLGAGQVGSLCLASIKIQTPGRKEVSFHLRGILYHVG